MLQVFVDSATDKITVLDNKKKPLVAFPAKGLKAAYAALPRCGGIQ